MTERKQFQRRIEDFTCEHCGASVSGNGYTNHCPKCLWSKHVDVQPGDRAEQCQGLMEPIGVEVGEPHKILHRCVRCGEERRCKSIADDDFETLLAIARGRQG